VPGGVPGSVTVPQPPLRQEEAIPYRSDMTRPQIVYRVTPQYTENARRARLEGTVIVQAVIDETGRVLDVQVLKTLPMGLDVAAAQAVAQWRFTPATFNGRPLKVIYTLTVNFIMK
jgi:TonB family protein